MRQHENSIFLRQFSEALRKARGSRSQAEFARVLGIKNQQTYQRYEQGVNEPVASIAHTLCSKIGVSFEDLLKGKTIPAVNAAITATHAMKSVATNAVEKEIEDRAVSLADFLVPKLEQLPRGRGMREVLIGYILAWQEEEDLEKREVKS